MKTRPFASNCRPSSWWRRPALFLILTLAWWLAILLLVGCAATRCRPSADVDLARWMETQKLDGTVEAVWVRCSMTF